MKRTNSTTHAVKWQFNDATFPPTVTPNHSPSIPIHIYHRHNGIAELLEILGSIINGFAIPLKKEHIQFLEKALIPLHKPRGVSIYHPQLSYCIGQYVEKDPETIVIIVNGLVRFWPWTSAAKQVLFLNELEEVLDLCRGEQMVQVQDSLFRLLAACLGSSHFQVQQHLCMCARYDIMLVMTALCMRRCYSCFVACLHIA